MSATIIQRLATELDVSANQITAAITLMDEGATVPFIARYRKEATGGLDDTQLRLLDERLGYLRELEDRRQAILRSIAEQDKLTPELEQAIQQAATKTLLEDLYLPYKPKRRTKAQIAREAGLEPLAEALMAQPELAPEIIAQDYLNPEQQIITVQDALEGAKQIIGEQLTEHASLLAALREYLWDNGLIKSEVVADKAEQGAKFADYFDYQEAIKAIPSHRVLAIFRGRNEGILQLSLQLPESATSANQLNACEALIGEQLQLGTQGAATAWLTETVRWTWRIKLLTRLELDLFNQLRETAEAEAIQVFARNLKALLLAAPAGAKVTLGLDPGLRTGVKVAIVDATGKLLNYTTIYPHAPQRQWQASLATLAELCQRFGVELISIGNGTASRETDQLASELIQNHPELQLRKIVVSEAGASVYSASELAAKEFPEVDVSLRGAVSIARRLQDPLAELVKIEPKAIGVGQYQHDVNQTQLARSLDAVVEDCVNAVGVDVNTASPALLAKISGLNPSLAQNIVELRNQQGAFSHREALKQVPRLGEKTYQLAAGFLRITNGANPLDASAVHPEAYPLVQKILQKHQKTLADIMGNSAFLKSLRAEDYVDEHFGLPTVKDILQELDKPGRDPRPEFKTASFNAEVSALTDLKSGMCLEGVVTNVTNFGAFVDIGVHQDGLVHISALTDKFIKDPHQVVKAGDIVKVKVLEVDVKRRRISLTMRLHETAAPTIRDKAATAQPNANRSAKSVHHKPVAKQVPMNNAFANAFAQLKVKQR